MAAWEWETFESFINEGIFHITDPGPLHAPVRSFSIKRNDKLQLILSTVAKGNARSTAIQHPEGTVRANTDKLEMVSILGNKVIATGVQPLGYHQSASAPDWIGQLREEASIHYLEAVTGNIGEPAYTIDWLANVERSLFVWPDILKDETRVTKTRSVGLGQDGLTLSSCDTDYSSGRCCVKLIVDGITIYFCVSSPSTSESAVCSKPGLIIYLGTPSDDIRQKIRECLSFSLGMYLVYLGNTAFCKEWRPLSFEATSAYSIDRKVFDLPVLPPAPIGTKSGGRTHLNVLDSACLSRMVNAIYTKYDELQFMKLSWAYWHAVCAVPHMAAAHFGAAIESLQRSYVKSYPDSLDTRLVADKRVWKDLQRAMKAALAQETIDDDIRKVLENKISNLNQTPWQVVTKRLLKHIAIELSESEQNAWNRRNHAAHGSRSDGESPLDVIRDFKLLRMVFHRILLRVTDASDSYFDYCTLGFPERRLHDPIPLAAR